MSIEALGAILGVVIGLIAVAAYLYGYWRGGQYVMKQFREKFR